MWIRLICAAVLWAGAAAAQSDGILVPIEPEPLNLGPIPSIAPIQEPGPSLAESLEPTGLPDLGGAIIGPADVDPSATQSIIASTWPDSIASVRAHFEPSSTWYQAVLNAGEAFGAQGFLDHHHAALGRFSEAIQRNGDGPFSARLITHWEYLYTLIPFIPTHPGTPTTGLRELTEEEMRNLFAIRLFDSFPAPTQAGQGRLTLAHADTQLPNGNAINIPMAAAEIADTRPYRTVTFTASAASAEPVDQVRFALTSPHPFRVLTSDALCTGENPTYCEMSGGAPYALELELLGPGATASTEAIWQGIDVTAAIWRDGVWQDEAADMWGMAFRRCDAVFVERINAQIEPPVDLRALFDRLSALASPDAGLPGTRLYPGPTRTAVPPLGGETRDIPTHPEAQALALETDILTRDLGLDAYLEGEGDFRGGLNAAVAAAQRFAALMQCNRAATADLYDTIGVQQETVDRQLDHYKTRIGYAALGRDNWVARMEAQRLVIRGMADVNGDGEDALADFVGRNTSAALRNLLATEFVGAEAAAFLGTATGAITQAVLYMEIIAALRELDVLLDWQQTILEASAYLEAETYLRGVERRYMAADEDLATLRLRLHEIEEGACTCYLPPARYP